MGPAFLREGCRVDERFSVTGCFRGTGAHSYQVCRKAFFPVFWACKEVKKENTKEKSENTQCEDVN